MIICSQKIYKEIRVLYFYKKKRRRKVMKTMMNLLAVIRPEASCEFTGYFHSVSAPPIE